MSASAKSVRVLLLAACGGVALAACETVQEVTNDALGNQFRAALNGANVPGGGDPNGSGIARIETNDTTNTICTDLEVREIGAVTGAHIHRGAPGTIGPPVVELDAPGDNDSDDCDTVDDALLDQIRNNPGGFYVNVHTAPFPQGAVRGNLQGGGQGQGGQGQS
ncbi:MAG: CHRD domain-containing protein [Pseudomonadota bacterium]|nr:CHRD domain-containing protein [Pseudomonadota bacterium]